VQGDVRGAHPPVARGRVRPGTRPDDDCVDDVTLEARDRLLRHRSGLVAADRAQPEIERQHRRDRRERKL
jgi:hypothetical protein